jgi:N-methylhydantoinase A/oxoprolinase/acetone carboxylase beta subunit
MVGTTQFVNAVIERKHLAKVFVVRLCGSATAALPPFVGMPADLVRQISAGYLLAPGESHISKPLAAPAQQHL